MTLTPLATVVVEEYTAIDRNWRVRLTLSDGHKPIVTGESEFEAQKLFGLPNLLGCIISFASATGQLVATHPGFPDNRHALLDLCDIPIRIKDVTSRVQQEAAS
jgi:hypothetical protein